MDSASQTISPDQIADLVVERLMEKGSLVNLRSATLEAIEDETLFSVDQITRDVISKLLGKQAELVEVPSKCPKCGGELCSQPSQARLRCRSNSNASCVEEDLNRSGSRSFL